MQIRGLHRAIYRGARLAFRRDGLSVKAAAAAKVPLSTLYRWQKGCERKSTRSHTVRKPKRDPRLAIAVERLRRKFPMGGKDKLAPLLWREGFDASVSMVGRILKSLVDRGAVEAVPNLRRRSKHAPRRHKPGKECPRVHGAYDHAMPEPGLAFASQSVLPSPLTHRVGASKCAFAAQYPAHASSLRRFANALADIDARNGADVVG